MIISGSSWVGHRRCACISHLFIHYIVSTRGVVRHVQWSISQKLRRISKIKNKIWLLNSFEIRPAPCARRVAAPYTYITDIHADGPLARADRVTSRL